MSVRIQVILKEDEAARFKSQAIKESKSLSAWLRDAGRDKLEHAEEAAPLSNVAALKAFFDRCTDNEGGREPDWEQHKQMVLDGSRPSVNR